MKIGESVVFTDTFGVEHAALLTNVFDNGDPEKYPNPAVNVVYVTSDGAKTDGHGRQIERAASCCHRSMSTVAGYTWRRSSE